MHSTSRLASETARQFLTSRIDYERTSSMPYGPHDFRLDRMRDLLARLGDPQNTLRIVHIAGTKGKGSTAAMIASVLRAAGLRTGLYSSPHLDRVEERLAIDGIACTAGELTDLVNRIRPVVNAMDAEPDADPYHSNRPTYFEIITALALMRFASAGVDAAVLEVGLGGRLDSTNVCASDVSVITSISFDHTQQLGNTLAEIAREKAGIIKPGTPVVSGVVGDEPREVVAATARDNQSPLIQLGRDFDFHYQAPRHLELADSPGRLDYRHQISGSEFALAGIELPLHGAHQAANAAVAIATLTELKRQGWNIPETAIRRGLAEVRWPARIELLHRQPAIVLDAAHNVASIEALVRVLAESFQSPHRLLVFATTRDKDALGMLRVLLPHFDEVIFTRYLNNPRGIPPEELAAAAAEMSAGRYQVRDDAAGAWALTKELVTAEHLVCICGSFFIAAEMRAAMAASPL